MNFKIFFKFTKKSVPHYYDVHKSRITLICAAIFRFCTAQYGGVLPTVAGEHSSVLWTMLKQLLNGNNGLLLILTPN